MEGHLVLGKDLESGERTEYVYNGLSMRVKSVKSLQNRAYGYKSYAQGAGNQQPFSVRETSYVTDYLSGTNNELMAYEKGFGEIRTVFGHGYGRLSRKLTLEPGTAKMPGTPKVSRETTAGIGGGNPSFSPTCMQARCLHRMNRGISRGM